MIPRLASVLFFLLALVASAQAPRCEYIEIADSSFVANFTDAGGAGSCAWCCLAMLGRHDKIDALKEPLGQGAATFPEVARELARRDIPYRIQSFTDRQGAMRHLADCIANRRPVIAGIWTLEEGVWFRHAVIVNGVDARLVWYVDPNRKGVTGMDRDSFTRLLCGQTLYLVR